MKTVKVGLVGRAAMALFAGLAMVAVPAATPAQAAACTANSSVASRWPANIGIRLGRNSSCTYYARFSTGSDAAYGAGYRWFYKVERLELTSYGYFVTATQSGSTLWGSYLDKRTGTVNGNAPGGAEDDHRACFGSGDVNGSGPYSWTCTEWAGY
ncbi:hypothetical protein ACFQFC_12220 [Amorphoplanes digitatis]|uniref:Uncharacterized protein n=1 Tax=Actinoplanes digitatis TaxID=1868 RepID=A0A7W7I1Z5_9ACTN|nr:hypothetical protein [Actinoplanes digitatis]MBB4764967.1 hypothetical protein [Actinoplanes digitatis]GID93939.1 hypothetical protein Adi01nite_33510 [Actinoplanes digitatis]